MTILSPLLRKVSFVIIQMHLTKMLRNAYVLSLAIFVTMLLAAQENPRFTSRTNLVPVPTLVRDANGNAVYGLQAKDFIIEDDGIPQKVYLNDTAEGEPISLVIAVQRGR